MQVLTECSGRPGRIAMAEMDAVVMMNFCLHKVYKYSCGFHTAATSPSGAGSRGAASMEYHTLLRNICRYDDST